MMETLTPGTTQTTRKKRKPIRTMAMIGIPKSQRPKEKLKLEEPILMTFNKHQLKQEELKLKVMK
jgi:hypothetical protein